MTEHTHSPNITRLKLSILITALFLLVEVIGGLLSGSLALVSDAGHMLSDLLSLILSLVAMILATSIATKERTYGLHRTEIFAGFINAVLLVVISGIVIWEAYQRFLSRLPFKGGIMMGVAIIGLIANLCNHLSAPWEP